MKLNVIALSLTAGIFWALAILMVASANLFWPGYGLAFLDLLASIYPGYHAASGAGSVLTAALYGLLDGAIAGGLFGGLYNLFAGFGRSD
jgi:hypothetical protein